MFISIVDLQIGQGDSDTLVSRIESDLIPIYQVSKGFVAYYAIKGSETDLRTIRVFDDLESLQVAVQDADEATQQIISDLQLTPSELTHAEASIAVTAGD